MPKRKFIFNIYNSFLKRVCQSFRCFCTSCIFIGICNLRILVGEENLPQSEFLLDHCHQKAIVFILLAMQQVPPSGSVLSGVFVIIKDAIVGWIKNLRTGEKPRFTFWEFAKMKHPKESVDDVSITLNVLKVFLLLPMFWSLFDQHSSRWVLQATLMDRNIFFMTLTADQIPILNPLFTLSLVPIFTSLIYPFLREKLRFSLLPIEQKMTAGMFITAISFAFSAVVQYVIDHTPPESVHVLAQVITFNSYSPELLPII